MSLYLEQSPAFDAMPVQEIATESERPYADSAYIYDVLYSNKRYKEEADALNDLVLPRIHSGGNDLLEVACGTGLYLEQFKADFNVEGLDLSPEQLDVARGKLPDTPLYEADMTSFELPKQYDVLMCLFSSIGCIQTPERLHAAVGSMSRALKPGGQIVIEPWVFKGELTGNPSVVTVETPDIRLVRTNTVVQEGDLSHVDMHYDVWRPEHGRELYRERMTMGLFSPEDYADALRGAGIGGIELYRDGLADGELFKRGLFVGTKLSDASIPVVNN